jgi:general secretion pathway protein G
MPIGRTRRGGNLGQLPVSAARFFAPRVVGRLSLGGFTIIELMIVIAIIMILVGIASGMYLRSVTRAKEATLKSDLRAMRDAIDKYTMDKESAPQSLEDLTNSQTPYLREIPVDPITRQRDWRVETGDVALTPNQSNTGVVDIHSNSDEVSPFEGTPYSSW